MKVLKNKTFSIITLGCKLNQYEEQIIREQLLSAGAKEVPFGASADIIIVNTCTVTASADRKSRQLIHRARRIAGPHGFVIATGCMAELFPRDLLKVGADAVIGLRSRYNFLDCLKKLNSQTIFLDENKTVNRTITDFYKHTRAFVKIQEGCSRNCSYCIIRKARGKPRSRSIDEIVCEVSNLLKRGFKEIVLVGTDLGLYGIDQGTNLILLLRRLFKLPIPRLRLTTLGPETITEEFLKILVDAEAFCPHFHLSIQSFSDSILKRMRRPYRLKHVLKAVSLIMKYFEKPGLGADIIAGFPGETESDFKQTMSYLQELPFSYFHVFTYSDRPGTQASLMSEKVLLKLRKERTRILREIASKKSLEFKKSILGRTEEVLVETIKHKGTGYFTGFTRNYVRVALEGSSSEDVNKIFVVKLQRLVDDVVVAFKSASLTPLM